MSILYTQTIILANDYIKALDEETDFALLCRFKMLVDSVAKYNETCQPCNNSKKLILVGEVGEAFSLTHEKNNH
jgi:hypothetical protein